MNAGRTVALVSLCAMLILVPIRPSFADPGDLDPSFGVGGRETTDIGGEAGRALAIQADGRILVTTTGGSPPSYDSDFRLARFNDDASLDTTFGTDGLASTDFSTIDPDQGIYLYRSDYPYALAVQPDGRIVIAGECGDYQKEDFAVARYNSNGGPDTTFGADGKVITDFGGSDHARDIVIQQDGKIIVAGGSDGDFSLVRYNSDGSLDSSFGTDGMVTTDFYGLYETAYGAALQSDGRIVLAGTLGDSYPVYNFAVARYNSDGSLDGAFNTDGRVITDLGSYDYGRDVVVQPDGKIVVGGSSGGDFAVVRYNADGTLDSSFSSDGMMTNSLYGNDYGNELALQPDGKIVLAGRAGGRFGVARYNADGTMDGPFGPFMPGSVSTAFSSGADAYSMGLQEDGRIVLAGTHDFSIAIARYFGGLWSTAANLGAGWHWLDWFGYFNLDNDPWIYHQAHGFLYPLGELTESVVFWDAAMNAFWWTSDTQYPYVYRFSDGEWLWYQEGSSDPRWFLRLTDGAWEQW